MRRYLAVLFADLERHSDVWAHVPRDVTVGMIAEYRYLAESLAGAYGCLYREWAGDGHMFLFESADTAAQFGLKLLESWRIAGEELTALKARPRLPLRLGCHFGECTRLPGEEAWIGRGNGIAKRIEGGAEPGSLYVSESLLDLLDLPLYRYRPVGPRALKGDHLPERALYRLEEFDQGALEAKPREELTAGDWFRRGVALIGTEEEWSEREAECYREALRLAPDYSEAHVNYAVLLRRRGESGEAAKHYQEALRLRPDYPEAHYNYAVLLANRGSTGGAAEHYRQALALRPEYVDAHHGHANLLAAHGELDEAAAHYEEALRLRPDYPEAHSDYAVLLEKRGDPAAAAAHYDAALRARPAFPEAHYNYALLLESAGDPVAAERHYREAIRLWPDYGEAHNNLAILLQLRGERAGAAEHYRLALQARPEDPETHYNYALLLRGEGDEEGALRHFVIAAELAPDVSTFRSALERSS